MKAILKPVLVTLLIAMNALIGPCVAHAAPNIEGIQTYQKNLHLSEERKQVLAEDISRYRNAENLWDVLRDEFAMPHYEHNPLVQQQIEWFMNHQEFLLHSATRAAPYLYYIHQQAKKRHLPAELVLLPVIESSYNPFAYSTAGAAGIWQMMPSTASGYGLKHTWWYDGRRDVVASTKAALHHLDYLQNFFDGNWLLAIAAYDTGEGNVLSAIRRNIRDGVTTEYWSLPLAQETKEYVPRLLALATIISHPEQYPVNFPSVRNAPYLAQVDTGTQIDLKHAARLAGLSIKKIMQLNPGYNRSIMDPNGPYKIILPIENVEQFSENLATSPLYPRVKWMRYKIRSGDTLTSIAQLFNIPATTLRKVNAPLLAENMKPGTTIMIPRSAPPISNTIMASEQRFMKSPERTAAIDSKRLDFTPTHRGHYSLQPGDTLYMVRSKDDLMRIAKRFHTTIKSLVSINNIRSMHGIKAGQTLIIPTHATNSGDAQKYQLASGDTVYTVKRDESLEFIAKKFHTTAEDIRQVNLLANNQVQEGDKLVIPTVTST